jgi:2-isopropylmalate synthase
MSKYQSYPVVNIQDRQWPNKTITKAPYWCSVDLRDGNQALATPMNIDQKLRMFKLLTDIGFKEIELGFPSASQIEFDFTRTLIEENLIPDDVAIQVLIQTRRHLIERTFESLKGVKKAIIHIYNSTSEQQRRITFGKTKEEIKQIAIDGTKDVISLLDQLKGTEVILEYSPESFTATEQEYALEVCEAVTELWNPSKRGKIILNLPSTVEMSTPNVFADRIEWFLRNFSNRNNIILSLHNHNDRGTGVAAAELGLLAGADRIEGSLFGNGERCGNMDIVTLALNMYVQGVDPKLDFSNILNVRKIYEECTGMTVPPRQPYSGDLVFTAFSGSHQDAIKKGMALLKSGEDDLWDVPYLPIDPKDVGRTYDAIIRINSQSGKGGVAYVLENEYGLVIPRSMQIEFGAIVNQISDELVRELSPKEIYDTFEKEYIKMNTPFSFEEYNVKNNPVEKTVVFSGIVNYKGIKKEINGSGNGPIDAFMNAVNTNFNFNLEVFAFEEQSIGTGSKTEAVSFIGLVDKKDKKSWGVGRSTDTSTANFTAILNSLNRYVLKK